MKIISIPHTANWGDAISKDIAEKLSGNPVELIYFDGEMNNKEEYYTATGSILGNIKTNNVYIWGVGFISKDSIMKCKPKEIFSVRGSETRNMLKNMGFSCPEVYGDPVLLFPKFYNPKIEKKYKLGIIPHYINNKNQMLDKFRKIPEIKVINILNTNKYEFIDDVLSCEKIISSSLHGIIVGDAYGIPSMWMKISDGVIGNGFKFIDYFKSVNRKEEYPYILTENTTFNDLLNIFYKYEIKIDLDKLLKSCPYNNLYKCG